MVPLRMETMLRPMGIRCCREGSAPSSSRSERILARDTVSKAWDKSRAKVMPPTKSAGPCPRCSSALLGFAVRQSSLTSLKCSAEPPDFEPQRGPAWEVSKLRQRLHVRHSERLQEFLGCACQTLSVRAISLRSKLRGFVCRFARLRYETQVRSGQAIVQMLLRVQGSTVASESLRHRLRAEFPGCCGSGAFGHSFPRFDGRNMPS